MVIVFAETEEWINQDNCRNSPASRPLLPWRALDTSPWSAIEWHQRDTGRPADLWRHLAARGGIIAAASAGGREAGGWQVARLTRDTWHVWHAPLPRHLSHTNTRSGSNCMVIMGTWSWAMNDITNYCLSFGASGEKFHWSATVLRLESWMLSWYPSECNYWIAIKPPHSNMSPAAARPPPSGTQRWFNQRDDPEMINSSNSSNNNTALIVADTDWDYEM